MERKHLDLNLFVRDVPDFPKPGILFKDITPLLADAEAFGTTIARFVAEFRDQRIDKVVGMESRGFLFGTPLAQALDAGFVPVRKPGKLPAETISETYSLEYGEDTLEIHKDAIHPGDRILVIDDLLATGGTAAATGRLIEKLGGTINGFAFVIELGFLNGRAKLGDTPVFSLLQFND
ncbi:MAG: adenine phosphoribosyltransferase [Deltaproteobacteria bacterium]|nr:MAG: adenine phosphoribosyltransferase [Deltaproteobacteria bacterium]